MRENPDDLENNNCDKHLAGHDVKWEIEAIGTQDSFVQKVHRERTTSIEDGRANHV